MVPKRWSKIRPCYLCPDVPHVQAVPVHMILSQFLEMLYKLEYSTKPTCVPRIAWYRQQRCFFPIWIFLKHLKSEAAFCKWCKQKFPHNAARVFVDESRINYWKSYKNKVRKDWIENIEGKGQCFVWVRKRECKWICRAILRTNHFLCQILVWNLCEAVRFMKNIKIFIGL